MRKVKELQLNAVDILSRQLAELEETLISLRIQKNTFDAEAKTYFFMRQAKEMADKARELYAEFHEENSVMTDWHQDLCTTEVL